VPDSSVTHWLGQLKAGDPEAAAPLWGRYFPRLVELARARLAGFPRRAADEEDVALSAFDSFCRDAAAGRLPRLDDRDDLWRVLLLITGQKALDLVRRESAAKRGGRPGAEASDLAEIAGAEPTPEFAALVADEFRRLIELLPDTDLRALAVWKMEGRTNEEVAARWGCVPRTVERRLKVIRSLWAGEVGS
jgi:DNA-directed RNA polymerase specialized sigma24 family protein